MRFLWGLQVKMHGEQELRPKSQSCNEGLVTLVSDQVVLWPCVWTLLVDTTETLKSQGTPWCHLSSSLLNTRVSVALH